MKPSFRLAIAVTVAMFLLGLVLPGANAQHAQKLSRRELKELIATAKTPADHEKLAAYYRNEAESLKTKQLEHEEELQEYYKHSSGSSSKYPTMGDHCRALADSYAMAAQKALAMADMHDQMAKEARRNEDSPK